MRESKAVIAALTGHGDAAPVSIRPAHCVSCRHPGSRQEEKRELP